MKAVVSSYCRTSVPYQKGLGAAHMARGSLHQSEDSLESGQSKQGGERIKLAQID